ncbi:isoprenylcysteine carboxylmethyltransferase family protein [uncultured Roseibium sp.]|uniref:methyltransferase family protein n=1 Tax=uncultured Roseibium sp. TaxID=1936171 RepID=UPI00261A8E8F|nr:isoprenylcysteine carboxylmethyltransferase family protein [uncultured Roseibium sp.]
MKLKVPPPLILVVAVVFTFAAASWFPGLTFEFPGQFVLAAILFFLGLVPDILALLTFVRRKTTVNPMAPEETSALVTDGIYRISRNPMYLGLLFLLIAASLYFSSFVSILIIPAFIAYLTEFQIKPEEEILREKFGEPYENYLRKVRRWV